jgi:nucleoside-diphosphate-sugar epimerase
MSLILVTGGGGFLGLAIVKQLVQAGHAVRTYSRRAYPELARLGVDARRGDLADPAAIAAATAGVDAVIHTAAKAGVAGPLAEYWRANVDGTQHVIDACRRHGVGRLVYTSSPSVVFGGADQEGLGGDAPYPRRFLAHYPRTKAEAERRVLAANGPSLATVSLRPHLIWGPGDRHLIPRLVARAKAKRLRLVAGGKKLVDSVYIDNAADAHLLALARLEIGSPIAGRAYFITNEEPWPLAELVGGILAAAGAPPARRPLPGWAAYAAGWALEGAHAALRPLGLGREPPLTRFVARQLATAHWYDAEPARRELGYRPRVSTREGLARLATHFAAGEP